MPCLASFKEADNRVLAGRAGSRWASRISLGEQDLAGRASDRSFLAPA
ncbi:hypothetical protein A2U01_0103445, partial [Trifolium medium]|nr:hypothetical protein [Trifolium medium]